MGKIAFVLSGGGNRGPIEIGALRSLVEHDIKADLVVGTSAGALNGVYYAAKPYIAGIYELMDIWLATKVCDAFPGANNFSMAVRALMGKDSLVDGGALRNTVLRCLPNGVTKFGDLAIPFYSVTVDIMSATTIIFGDEADTPLLEPVLASASFPIVLPPVEYDGFQLSDGGVTAVVPIEVALQRGATELYVIDLEPTVAKTTLSRGVLAIAMQTLMTSLREQLYDDLRDATNAGVTLHHVNIQAFPDLPLFDFSKTKELIDSGYVSMNAYLDNPKPNAVKEQALKRMPKGGRPLRA